MNKHLRIHGNRQQQLDRLRSQGWTVLQVKTAPIVVAFQNGGHGTWVKGWTGKADKPAFFHSFHNQAQAESWVSSYVASKAKSIATLDERKATKIAKLRSLKTSDHWTVGDVVYNSWGYEQTNVDWYQVVEVMNKSIMIQPIAEKTSYSQQTMAGQTQPDRNNFTGPGIIKRVDGDGRIQFKFGCGMKWDGTARRFSCYA